VALAAISMKPRDNIETFQKIASDRGGKCISEIYKTTHTKLIWECKEGHQWEARPSSIKRGAWCPACNGNVKLSISEMQTIAIDRGGQCLSEKYINSTTKLKWKCKNGHFWDAIPAAIKKGQWCKKCSDAENSKQKRILRLEKAKEYAKQKNGICLSNSYISEKDRFEWQCEKGHKWITSFGSMKSGNTWCPHCSNKAKLTIEQMQNLALLKEGKCLSKKYVNIDTKLLWECKEGHQWKSIPYLIKKGHWCPKCSSMDRASKQRTSISDIHSLAKSRGGKFISGTYLNSQTKLLWECNNGHQWKSATNSIQQGSWCPKCSAGLGERICNVFFEHLFNTEFTKTYPNWLINEDGNQMELDGFSEKYKLAFEHQGGQHYYVDGFFIKTEEQLARRKRNDKTKLDLCKKHNIKLIAVPEIPKYLKVENIKSFIKKECLKQSINLLDNYDEIEVDLLKAYTPADKLEELKALAKDRGGLCLGNVYLGTQNNMMWQCKEGHKWQAIPNRIKGGSWCPICANTIKLTIDEMRSIAEINGGKCLSNEYVNNRTSLLWQCKEKHQWKAQPSNIKGGKWCPKCSKKKVADSQRCTINEMQELAEKSNGKCISEEYKTTHTKLTWECKKGHQWQATPSLIKQGSWCPVCSGNNRPTIQDMREIAREKNGKCLSEKYASTHSKLLWQCEKGHKWKAAPSSIKSGSWCPVCAGNTKLTIEDMQVIAIEKGGKCLSEKYVNVDTKLLWECKDGHQWKTIPYLIRTGSWCPTCGNKNKGKKAANTVYSK